MPAKSDAEYKLLSKQWALAPTTSWSVQFVLGAATHHFRLHNVLSGYNHSLTFRGKGLIGGIPPFPIGFSFTLDPNFTQFQTNKAVNFDDFDSKTARISKIKATVAGAKASIMRVTIYERWLMKSPELCRIDLMEATGRKASEEIPGARGGVMEGHLSLDRDEENTLSGIPIPYAPKIPDPPRVPRYSGYTHVPGVKHVRRLDGPKVVIQGNILFAFDSARIKPSAASKLDYLTEILNNRKSHRVVIEGHTDSQGSKSYNKTLSLQRARAVKMWLIQCGVLMAEEFLVRGLGEEHPIAPNVRSDGSDNPAGRAENRRIEILVD